MQPANEFAHGLLEEAAPYRWRAVSSVRCHTQAPFSAKRYVRYRTDALRVLDTVGIDCSDEALMEPLQAIEDLPTSLTDRGLMLTVAGVIFVNGTAELKAVASTLDQVVVILGRHAGREVVIEGHTDSLGSDGYNHGLSQRRADMVKSYLIDHGVPAPRLIALGKGGSSPVAGNHTAAGRQRNSRVEVIIRDAPVTAS
jgi:outer membrane protein OmpA-like peptidoglycan-associated protein